MRAVDGAVEAVNSLAENYVIVIVSARNQSLEQATVTWLDENGFRYDEVHCAESLTDKSPYNLDILVDDDLRTVKNFARSPPAGERRLAILFDRPWNQWTDAESRRLLRSGKMIRRRSWREIASDLLSSL
jgi:5'(3')-deoxyribonucleotidase